MTKIDREVFVENGAKGGKATGPSKRRGGPEYYRALALKSAKARAKKRKEEARGK